MQEHILVVDDEKEIAELVSLYLKNEGYTVCVCTNGRDALREIENSVFDMAVLDVMLPDIDGFSICRKIREKFFYPIIMLTAKIEDIDKIMGLTTGADDYITKPFNPLELIARVKTQLRRYKQYGGASMSAQDINARDSSEYDIRGLYINKETHVCTVYGKKAELTPIEFSILLYMCANRGRVISSEELFENVWGEKFINNNNTVMAHIGRLREKLNEPSGNPKFIKTVWGVGYKIE